MNPSGHTFTQVKVITIYHKIKTYQGWGGASRRYTSLSYMFQSSGHINYNGQQTNFSSYYLTPKHFYNCICTCSVAVLIQTVPNYNAGRGLAKIQPWSSQPSGSSIYCI